jgi:hypothetical protein
MRALLSRALAVAENMLQEAPTPEEIRETVLEMYEALSALPPEKASAAIARDVALSAGLLAKLKWIDAAAAAADETAADDKLLTSARAWKAALSQGGVLQAGRVAAGAGVFLDVLGGHGNSGESQFAMEQAERLLRHVEVKRQQALAQVSPEIPPQRLTMEKWDVAILFSRGSVRHGDLRFLNAALKMNDWSLKSHGRRPRLSVEQRARFLLSLTEQESAAGALL